jgi:hypothetical protein
MVKNDGGNKGKGLARKHVTSGGSNKQLRVAVEDGERYAVVSKMLGNGMCYVRLLSGGGAGADKLCIIRNKFKGRGKRDNILDSGSWVLIGLREWSSKQDTCDLLEVYNHGERDRLMKNEPCFKSVTTECDADSSSSSSANAHSTVQFADSATMKYSNMVKGQADDSDDEVMQQRAYDMPTSSDDDDDGDETMPMPAAAALKPTPTPKPNPNPKLKVDHIDVDDI